MAKIIKFYRKNQYGVEREFVHPDNMIDAQFICVLTGKNTINKTIRERIKWISTPENGLKTIEFQEVIAPQTK
jgi:hypothetical protein